MSILITGSSGQLGTELCRLLKKENITFVGVDSQALDVTNKEQVSRFIKQERPSVVFHCAAYTAVDKAEDEGKEQNYLVNETGTRNVAEACQKVGATMVYISTDYVFDGKKERGEYKEEDPTHPINEYGRAKWLGEEAVRETMTDYYIIRTSWVFGQYGHNFVYTMQKLAQTHPKLTVVNDQHGRPTWTYDLASFMLYATQQQIPFGTYHFSNDDSCTWYEFACTILQEADVLIEPVDSSSFPQKAKRPQHSIMSLEKVKETGYVIPTWEMSLKEMMESFIK